MSLEGKQISLEILKKNIKDKFLEVYPEISSGFNSNEHDGQNAFEVALQKSGFFDIVDILEVTGKLEEVYFELFYSIPTLNPDEL